MTKGTIDLSHSNHRNALIHRAKHHIVRARKLIAKIPLYTLRRKSKQDIARSIIEKLVIIDQQIDELTKDD